MLSLQSTDIERILADFCLEPKARSDRKWKLKNRICHRQKTEAYVSFCELTLAVEQNYYLRLECFGAQTDMFRHIDSIMKPRNLPENPQTLLRGHKYRVSVFSGVSALLKLNRKSITLL